MEAAIIRDCKPLIGHSPSTRSGLVTAPLPTLQEHYAALMSREDAAHIDWPYVLQKLYIHACLKGRRDVATWLASLFDALDPISRIA
jgi:hypothetical protein